MSFQLGTGFWIVIWNDILVKLVRCHVANIPDILVLKYIPSLLDDRYFIWTVPHVGGRSKLLLFISWMSLNSGNWYNPINVSLRYADSGKTLPYSSLGKCFTLKVTEIIKQVRHFMFIDNLYLRLCIFVRPLCLEFNFPSLHNLTVEGFEKSFGLLLW